MKLLRVNKNAVKETGELEWIIMSWAWNDFDTTKNEPFANIWKSSVSQQNCKDKKRTVPILVFWVLRATSSIEVHKQPVLNLHSLHVIQSFRSCEFFWNLFSLSNRATNIFPKLLRKWYLKGKAIGLEMFCTSMVLLISTCLIYGLGERMLLHFLVNTLVRNERSDHVVRYWRHAPESFKQFLLMFKKVTKHYGNLYIHYKILRRSWSLSQGNVIEYQNLKIFTIFVGIKRFHIFFKAKIFLYFDGF